MPWSKSAVESPERTRERLIAKVRIAPSGCWEWTAYIDKGTGYGRLNTPRGVKWAHRISYEIHVGPIPEGSPLDEKEEKLRAFTDGEIRVLVTKPSIAAWGLNWQHCNRMTFFPSHSYEQYYQAVRRCWRFGQQHPVTVDVITTDGGRNALANLQRKAAQADRMFDSLVTFMRQATEIKTGHHFDESGSDT